MPNLSIKDVPEALAEALRRRAARNHRSLQGELMHIVERTLMLDSEFRGEGTTREIFDEVRRSGVFSGSEALKLTRETRSRNG